MSKATKSRQAKGLENVFAVRSDKLKELRRVIQSCEDLNNLLEGAAQFSLVVDSNIIIGDILWFVEERRFADAKTHLMEIIEAGTVKVFVPPSLLAEVEEKIPLIAEEKKLSEGEMYGYWEIYKTMLVVQEPDADCVENLRSGIDPDDADFVALEKTIPANGIFSKDKHIGMMGGNQISIQCIGHLRNYSRAKSIELNIKVNGVMFVKVSVAAIRGLSVKIKNLIDGISAAPDWLKMALIAGGLLVVLHPNARENLACGLRAMLVSVTEATPTVIACIAEIAVFLNEHEQKAKHHLNEAMKELGRNQVTKNQENGTQFIAPRN